MAIARVAVLFAGLALASASSADEGVSGQAEGVSGEARRAASNRESTSEADTQAIGVMLPAHGGRRAASNRESTSDADTQVLRLVQAVQGGVALKNAWMRPAVAGAAARAYVDITSDTSLTLVGAKTPVAKRVELVRVATIGDPTTEKVVKSMAVPANTTTRLAYHGDHVRFIDMNRNVGNGDPVPLTLLFKDAKGKRSEATTDVLVRGLLRPQQMPEAARDAPPPKQVQPAAAAK
jgi:copper(I)-binding protein